MEAFCISSNYNANLYELKTHEPLKVNSYYAKLEPIPTKPAHFYQVLGRLAKRLTESTGTAVISDEGKIKVLESTLLPENLVAEIELENIAKFKVALSYENVQLINLVDDPVSYGRLVNKIVDLALCHLSNEFYKYHEFSPYIIERGEGYFDKALRQRIGVEDGRRFYRGLRIVFGKPYLLINREIELRSSKNLLNELKSLGEWWQRGKKINGTFDFYNPPIEFIDFINRAFRNRTANVIAYSSPSVVIKEITWESRANSKVLQGNTSPIEYHKASQGIIVKDENQPLIKWKLMDKNTGLTKEQYHVPELLVVGHTFKDLKMRLLSAQVSQVFDILHPNCGDQQRLIFDIVRKIDYVLRNNFRVVYPSKLEFTQFPADINKAIEPAQAIKLRFANKDIEISPPYGLNFYRKYSIKEKFAEPIAGVKRVVTFAEAEHLPFIDSLIQEIESRNECKVVLERKNLDQLSSFDAAKCDLVITVTNDGDTIKAAKKSLIGQQGTAHQNITPEKANAESIPQVAMQVTLKLGGYPWLLSNTENIKILTIYAYRNPFTDMRCFLFNLFTSEGRMIHQSKPFDIDNLQAFLDEVSAVLDENDRLLVMMSFWDEAIEEQISAILSHVNEYFFIKILQNNELQFFSTFKPLVTATPRRRTTVVTYPCEAYENAPQGIIMNTGDGEYYALTTGSTKVGTYYRGCPTPIRIKVIGMKGCFDSTKVLHHVLSLSFASGVSGHGTRLPAPLYYLKAYAKYVNEYGLPSADKIFQTIFYV